MIEFTAKVHSIKDGDADRAFPVRRMYNLGSATRDPDTATPHQQEVAKSGIHIAFDIPAPRIYPIAINELTSAKEVYAQSDRSSGEVEIVMHMADQLYISVGSDHTDRALETFSIPGSKQACANHMAPEFWPFEEIRDHWDECILRSWVDGRLYQEVGVAKFLHPETMVATVNERVNGVPERDYIIFSGTIVSVDKELGFGEHWKYEIEDPVKGRSIKAEYRVVNILSEVKDGYQVPLFNPKKD